MVDPGARRDVPDGGRRESALGKQVGGGPQHRRNDFVSADRRIGATRVGACANCSHMTTVPTAGGSHERAPPMAKTPCTLPTTTHYGRFIGRVGGLAVALGIGVAIANNPGIAAADDGQSTASEKSSATSESPDSRPSTPDSNPVKTAVKQLQLAHRQLPGRKQIRRGRTSEVSLRSNAPRDDTPSSDRENSMFARRAQAIQETSSSQIAQATPKPATPAPSPALVGSGGLRTPRA